jgi:hypothetical protein
MLGGSFLGDVDSVAFSPDGSRVAAAGFEGSVGLWPLPATALALACVRVHPFVDRARVAAICD